MTHTPGPWEVTRGYNWFTIGGGKNKESGSEHIICEVRAPTAFRAHEGEANARLIAAAPELLQALDEMVAEWDTKHAEETHLTGITPETFGLELARKAIAKAHAHES